MWFMHMCGVYTTVYEYTEAKVSFLACHSTYYPLETRSLTGARMGDTSQGEAGEKKKEEGMKWKKKRRRRDGDGKREEGKKEEERRRKRRKEKGRR